VGTNHLRERQVLRQIQLVVGFWALVALGLSLGCTAGQKTNPPLRKTARKVAPPPWPACVDHLTTIQRWKHGPLSPHHLLASPGFRTLLKMLEERDAALAADKVLRQIAAGRSLDAKEAAVCRARLADRLRHLDVETTRLRAVWTHARRSPGLTLQAQRRFEQVWLDHRRKLATFRRSLARASRCGKKPTWPLADFSTSVALLKSALTASRRTEEREDIFWRLGLIHFLTAMELRRALEADCVVSWSANWVFYQICPADLVGALVHFSPRPKTRLFGYLVPQKLRGLVDRDFVCAGSVGETLRRKYELNAKSAYSSTRRVLLEWVGASGPGPKRNDPTKVVPPGLTLNPLHPFVRADKRISNKTVQEHRWTPTVRKLLADHNPFPKTPLPSKISRQRVAMAWLLIGLSFVLQGPPEQRLSPGESAALETLLRRTTRPGKSSRSERRDVQLSRARSEKFIRLARIWDYAAISALRRASRLDPLGPVGQAAVIQTARILDIVLDNTRATALLIPLIQRVSDVRLRGQLYRFLVEVAFTRAPLGLTLKQVRQWFNSPERTLKRQHHLLGVLEALSWHLSFMSKILFVDEPQKSFWVESTLAEAVEVDRYIVQKMGPPQSREHALAWSRLLRNLGRIATSTAAKWRARAPTSLRARESARARARFCSTAPRSYATRYRRRWQRDPQVRAALRSICASPTSAKIQTPRDSKTGP